jgi:DNA-binding phage protein
MCAFATAPPNRTDQNLDRVVQDGVLRLRDAVKAAGGLARVADLSGIPGPSLKRYLAGRNEMKQSVLIALADACGITIEWLAAGRGPMRPTDSPDPGPSSQPRQNGPEELFATVDMDRLAAAMAGASEAFTRKGTRPSWRRMAQVTALIYDGIGDGSQVLDATEDKEK